MCSTTICCTNVTPTRSKRKTWTNKHNKKRNETRSLNPRCQLHKLGKECGVLQLQWESHHREGGGGNQPTHRNNMRTMRKRTTEDTERRPRSVANIFSTWRWRPVNSTRSPADSPRRI